MSMGIVPEKRSAEATTEAAKRSRITEFPEDSHRIDYFAEGNVARDNHNDNVARYQVSDSDDDMYFDPPGSIKHYASEDTKGWQLKADHIPVWSNCSEAYCGVCEGETGHLAHECPYRCNEAFENVRCWKKVHNDDNHDYGIVLREPCADCENTEFGCDEHCF